MGAVVHAHDEEDVGVVVVGGGWGCWRR